MSEPERQKPTQARSNGRVVFMCLFFVFGMGAMSYAAVPLYQLFCQVTGYGGTTQRVDQYADKILDRTIKVRFDANTNGLPWDFQPKQREVEVRIGETKQVFYESQNNSSAPRGGQATFNVTPQYAGVYFNKVECFCFTELRLEGGERLDMPVVFYIDPEIVEHPETKNLTTITLSYTMFPRELEKPVASVDTGDAQDGERL